MEFENVDVNISNSSAEEEPVQTPLQLLQNYDDTPQLSYNFIFKQHLPYYYYLLNVIYYACIVN